MDFKQILNFQGNSIETLKNGTVSEIMAMDKVKDALNFDSSKQTKDPQEDDEDSMELLSQSKGVQKTNQWSSEEIRTLFALFKELGSRWTSIAKMIPNKSENAIKNKFNCCMRKFTRKLNKINKESHTKFRKQIRTESVFRIIQAAQLFPNMEVGMKMKSLQIRQRILIQARKQVENEENENIIDLINDINNFNLKTRSHKNPKHKRRKDIILFEPAKEFSDTCQISYDKITTKVVNPKKETSDDKVDPNAQNSTGVNLQPKNSQTNFSLEEFEHVDNDFYLPIHPQFRGQEKEDCFWTKVLDDKEFGTKDQNLWFEH